MKNIFYLIIFPLLMILLGCNKDPEYLIIENHDSSTGELLSLSDLKVGVRYRISQIKPEEFALLEVENPYARTATHRVRAWHHYAGNVSATLNLNINGSNINLTPNAPNESSAVNFTHYDNIPPGFLNRTWTYTYTTSATDWYATGYLKTYEISGGGLVLLDYQYVNMSNWQPGAKSIYNEVN